MLADGVLETAPGIGRASRSFPGETPMLPKTDCPDEGVMVRVRSGAPGSPGPP